MSRDLRNQSADEQEQLDGNPSTVRTPDGFIMLQFQLGPVREHGVNGCQIDEVLDVLIARLQGFQAGPFSCRENALAITKMEEAKHWLEARTRKRVHAGVEGTNVQHPNP